MNSLKILVTTTISVALLSTAASARDLSVVSWGGSYQEAQRTAYFAPYIAETGKALLDEAYNGELAKIKAMVENGDVTWDVVQMEAPELETSCNEGLLEKIDWEKLGGKATFLPEGVIGECGVGANVWSTVMAFDSAVLGADGPKNWADFWDTTKFPGKRGLRKSAKLTLEIALLADGVAPGEIYTVLSTEEGIARAFSKLDTLKDSIQWWESGAQPMQWLAAGDVVMSSAYNGRVSAANAEGHAFTTVWDGQIASVDGWVIVKGTPNLDDSYKFLNVASVPKNQVILSEVIPYGPTVVGAMELIKPELQKNLPNYPANATNIVAQDTVFWIENGEELSQKFNNWASQ